MLGTNVDPSYKEACPDPGLLNSLGLRWVRLVSKDSPAIHSYIQQCNQKDISVLAVIARESNGYIIPGAQVYQIGNEPDVNSPSSWTRTPAEYREDWRIYRDTYPGLMMIAAGMASGIPEWFRQVWVAGPLKDCSGIAVHPYTKTPLQARDLVNQYKLIAGVNMPVWVTEWNNKKEEVQYFTSLMQNANVVATIWFPWTTIQNNTLNGLRENDDLRRLLCA